jgi:hypothetical protein
MSAARKLQSKLFGATNTAEKSSTSISFFALGGIISLPAWLRSSNAIRGIRKILKG